ncbi:hypothetical protein GGS26DRAFT_210822 [Hypomontagnella submonticulosa]|nr:hypothetical protein GGS26DRAFT_210822 [Hypomontagnella submonticulosa]
MYSSYSITIIVIVINADAVIHRLSKTIGTVYMYGDLVYLVPEAIITKPQKNIIDQSPPLRARQGFRWCTANHRNCRDQVDLARASFITYNFIIDSVYCSFLLPFPLVDFLSFSLAWGGWILEDLPASVYDHVVRRFGGFSLSDSRGTARVHTNRPLSLSSLSSFS